MIDRFWFKSVYFHEPGGVLFELATEGPGFAVDEDAAHLGESLVLPPWLEPQRPAIVAALPSLSLPAPVQAQLASDRRAEPERVIMRVDRRRSASTDCLEARVSLRRCQPPIHQEHADVARRDVEPLAGRRRELQESLPAQLDLDRPSLVVRQLDPRDAAGLGDVCDGPHNPPESSVRLKSSSYGRA